MFPLKDHNPTRRIPVVTILLVVINVIVFVYELMLGDRLPIFVAGYGAIPFEITHFTDLVGNDGGPFEQVPGPGFIPLTVFTSMFMHGSLMHIFGNMLYLWIFGNNVEDILGRLRFLFFYLACGVIAALTHCLANPNSMVPTVGASGAVAGILGAYIVAFPRARVRTLVFLGIFLRVLDVPAVILLGLWFVMQSLQGLFSLGVHEMTGGVAWFAHVGGFIAGAVGMVLIARDRIRDSRDRW
jgi:membrane associated rhomboid family serine protease